MTTTKRCAACKIIVTPANWVRLTSGILLCQKCDIEGPPDVPEDLLTPSTMRTCPHCGEPVRGLSEHVACLLRSRTPHERYLAEVSERRERPRE